MKNAFASYRVGGLVQLGMKNRGRKKFVPRTEWSPLSQNHIHKALFNFFNEHPRPFYMGVPPRGVGGGGGTLLERNQLPFIHTNNKYK